MTVPRSIETAGPDEEIEKYLAEFARGTGGWAARDPRRGGWVVAGGALLSTNPNCVRWRIRVRREENLLSFAPEAFRPPWTRSKGARIAAFRQGQLADYLETRLRGGGPGKFDARRLREPFAPFGSGAAAFSASFAWVVAGGLGAVALAFATATLASFLIMGPVLEGILARSLAVQTAGDLPLPSEAERASVTFGFRLGCALVFAFPLGFFAALLHTTMLVLGEAWARAARLGQASFLFLLILVFLACLPFVGALLAALSAALISLGTHAGYALVWGRRGERLREVARPRRAAASAGAILAGLIAFFLVPRPASGGALQDRMALFRDRYLLGHIPGKALSLFYYRHALYAADPLKRFFSADDKLPARSQRTAAPWRHSSPSPPDSGTAALFRWLDFSISPSACAGDLECARHDVHWFEDKLSSGDAGVTWDPKRGLEGLQEALHELAGRSYRGATLRDLSALSWHALYYAGALVAVLAFAGICAPWVSILFRVLPRKAATAAILFCMVSTTALVLLDYSRNREISETVEGIRANPSPERLAAALAHRSHAVRHEAAYLACRNPDPSLAKPLLSGADDPDFRVRLWAVAALGKTKTADRRALDKLRERLRDSEFFVRYRAAEGLGDLGSRAAEEDLVQSMTEGGWYEGLYALMALRKILPDKY